MVINKSFLKKKLEFFFFHYSDWWVLNQREVQGEIPACLLLTGL